MSRSEKFLDEALNCKQSGFCDLQRLCVQTDKNCCERKQPSDLQCDLGGFSLSFCFSFYSDFLSFVAELRDWYDMPTLAI